MENLKFDGVFLLITNIPPDLSGKFVRHFFSSFIESCGFLMFHYLRRPTNEILFCSASKSTQEPATLFSNCCVVKVYADRLDEFFDSFNGKKWEYHEGRKAMHCLIKKFVPMKLDAELHHCRSSNQTYILDNETFTLNYLESLDEMNPPDYLPRGNIGTRKSFLMSKIKSNQLPRHFIYKLGLHFNEQRYKQGGYKNRKREGRYYNNYGGKVIEDTKDVEPKYADRDGLEIDALKEFAAFEKYSTGIGRKVLESQGWRQGQGVGREATGIAEPLPIEGQKPTEKMGLGYTKQGFRQKLADRRVKKEPSPSKAPIMWTYGGKVHQY